MYELKECLSATRTIKDVCEEIEEIRSKAMSPKNQIITGMPRGGFSRKSDDYVVRLERLERICEKMRFKRDDNWNYALKKFRDANIKPEYIQLMMLRFYSGLQWKKCCEIMIESYPDQNWNINKVFRTYRNVLSKTEHS